MWHVRRGQGLFSLISLLFLEGVVFPCLIWPALHLPGMFPIGRHSICLVHSRWLHRFGNRGGYEFEGRICGGVWTKRECNFCYDDEIQYPMLHLITFRFPSNFLLLPCSRGV